MLTVTIARSKGEETDPLEGKYNIQTDRPIRLVIT